MVLIGTVEAAQILDVHPKTIRRRVAARDLTPVQRSSGGVMWFDRDVVIERAKADALAELARLDALDSEVAS